MWPRPDWQRAGHEPDYRFSLANERTFLAWLRTALSLLAGGLLLVQFSTSLAPRPVVVGAAVGLTALAALLSVTAWLRWRANEQAMRHARPLPATAALLVAAVSLSALCGVLGALVLVSA